MIPGKPKLGVVAIGGDNHGGHGYKSAVVDDYPIKFGTVRRKKPASSQAPPAVKIKSRRFYGQER